MIGIRKSEVTALPFLIIYISNRIYYKLTFFPLGWGFVLALISHNLLRKRQVTKRKVSKYRNEKPDYFFRNANWQIS
jgi:hypothetical protein